ncbi:MAG: transcriptional regulator [Gammaproteobacteria bacterium]|jgi:DNA-binding MarR family transcriptional regulator|nr:transcriptional regulator [Gammaproteobacteria bacterium]
MKSGSPARGTSRGASAADSKLKASNGGDTNGAAATPLRFGPLADYVGYALRRAQMSSVTGFLDAMKEVDLRPTQFAVLTLINENPGVRQNDICAALGLQKANFVPLLNELQRRGLAVRKEGVADRRSSALHLTPAGMTLLRRALELHTEWERRILARLGTRGRDQLLVLLNKLL